ncbi:Exodeoxyribonuclease VII small subunit [Ferrithrix thermotolerans DSM 19514]|jgi:exodeoxyribonuclease VII small subunit|uniref:Exodeoxyribonuclease VII small subunit n=1 Tax=Ferrithrix thermotolerans DSM 19514 TaxID=1121881 RepID=A0A1M4T273_9ACTN|nr:exodeoxyribonuclease VII small subunit [Ferrithrix thermotolerans]SHE38566.1 Exodeoxyribonuclease VII small subunit [Ferrithrix thermotolerans DSM 19514]
MSEVDLASFSYEELKGQLQQIVDDLSAGNVKIDDVSKVVERSRLIVAECQRRLKGTKEQIEAMMAEIQGSDL